MVSGRSALMNHRESASSQPDLRGFTAGSDVSIVVTNLFWVNLMVLLIYYLFQSKSHYVYVTSMLYIRALPLYF